MDVYTCMNFVVNFASDEPFNGFEAYPLHSPIKTTVKTVILRNSIPN